MLPRPLAQAPKQCMTAQKAAVICKDLLGLPREQDGIESTVGGTYVDMKVAKRANAKLYVLIKRIPWHSP